MSNPWNNNTSGLYTNNAYNPPPIYYVNSGQAMSGMPPIEQPPPTLFYHPPPIIPLPCPSPYVANLSQPPPQIFSQPPPTFPQFPKSSNRKSRWDAPSCASSYKSKVDTELPHLSDNRYAQRERNYIPRRGSRSKSRSLSRDRLKDRYPSKRRPSSVHKSPSRYPSRRSRSGSPIRKKQRGDISPSHSRPGTSYSNRTPSKRGGALLLRCGTPPRSSAPRTDSGARKYASTGRARSKNGSSLTSGIAKPTTERAEILERWRKNFCSTGEQVQEKIMEMYKQSKRNKIGNDGETVEIDKEKRIWTRSTPAELYYSKKRIVEKTEGVLTAGTDLLWILCEHFKETLVLRAKKANESKPKYEPPPRKNRARICKHKTEQGTSSDSSSEEQLTDEEDCTMEELTRKQQHPFRLHPEMWYNDPGEMNDGPLCRCSNKSRKSGIRHGIYPGEQFLQICDKSTNNADTLYHYRITISPPTNFLIKTPTIIQHDEHEFIFEGFSMFSHKPLVKLPTCKVIRFNIEYTILYIEEMVPENFTIRELDLYHDYLFCEILELVDLDFKAFGDEAGCSQFHFMPRFVRELKPTGKEILSMNVVLEYLIKSSGPLIRQDQLEDMVAMEQYDWQAYADEIKGMVVTYPGKKPCSVRVDQLDRNVDLQKKGDYKYPEIVHFGIRPPQLSYAGNPEYQKAWRDYVKFRHLLANMSKPTYEDKRKLEAKESKLQEMRTQSKMKRDVTIAVSAEGFFRTGIMCDVIQHAMLVPVLVCHLRFHNALDVLEDELKYKFRNRALLQLALTHPSYRENFGTNPDHARNSLTNCGIRQPEYGDRRIHYMNTRKRGINTLINIMSRFGSTHETESLITHNERLEFLGDAVVEFLSSIHLFHIFPELEEGGLATYRAAIVQNQHLAVLARVLQLDRYMLYAHGSDLCHDLELRHAMANCYEALMGALFLDGGIDVVDRVFSLTLFQSEQENLDVWVNYPPHPLQEQEPDGDRHWIQRFDLLKKLTQFETSIGLEFNHIRLLARAFTDRSVGYTNLTLGSNQRLEFLGDTVLQLIASEYLYKYFPEHHEGHLSLLRSSLVNNRTQAVVCDDLGMSTYAVYNNPKADLKTKDRADLLEAFIGALFVDRGLTYCEGFCEVTLFPRLQDFIMNQDWNDPKSKLQQCCLTLRTMDGGEPDIPVYKVIECKGPTNTRVYTVAVYFRGHRLASAMGHSIQQAEMNAAKEALEISQDLFPQLDHQKRVIAKSMKRQQPRDKNKSTPNQPVVNKNNSGNEGGGNRSLSQSRGNYRKNNRRDTREDRSSSRQKERASSSHRDQTIFSQQKHQCRSISRQRDNPETRRSSSHSFSSQKDHRSRSMSQRRGQGTSQIKDENRSESRQSAVIYSSKFERNAKTDEQSYCRESRQCSRSLSHQSTSKRQNSPPNRSTSPPQLDSLKRKQCHISSPCQSDQTHCLSHKKSHSALSHQDSRQIPSFTHKSDKSRSLSRESVKSTSSPQRIPSLKIGSEDRNQSRSASPQKRKQCNQSCHGDQTHCLSHKNNHSTISQQRGSQEKIFSRESRQRSRSFSRKKDKSRSVSQHRDSQERNQYPQGDSLIEKQCDYRERRQRSRSLSRQSRRSTSRQSSQNRSASPQLNSLRKQKAIRSKSCHIEPEMKENQKRICQHRGCSSSCESVLSPQGSMHKSRTSSYQRDRSRSSSHQREESCCTLKHKATREKEHCSYNDENRSSSRQRQNHCSMSRQGSKSPSPHQRRQNISSRQSRSSSRQSATNESEKRHLYQQRNINLSPHQRRQSTSSQQRECSDEQRNSHQDIATHQTKSSLSQQINPSLIQRHQNVTSLPQSSLSSYHGENKKRQQRDNRSSTHYSPNRLQDDRFRKKRDDYKQPIAGPSKEVPHPFTTRAKSPSSYSRNRFRRNKSESVSD